MEWSSRAGLEAANELDIARSWPKNGDMIRRTATLGLVAVFLATILCAVICLGVPAQSHVCDRPDHSCCPKSNHESAKLQCVDTHFMASSKYAHAAPDFAPFTTALIVAIPAPHPMSGVKPAAHTFTGPSHDLLDQIQILRI